MAAAVTDKCEQHPGRQAAPAPYYCLQCHALACQVCLDESTHYGHGLRLLKEAAEQQQRDLQDKLDVLALRLDGLKLRQDQMDTFELSYLSTRRLVQQKCGELTSRIREHEERLLKEAADIHETTYKKFGFRKQPYAQRHRLLGAFSFKKLGARGTYEGTFVRESSRDEYTVGALASGIEINNFYGFGNNTTSDPGRDFFKTDQNDFRLGAAYRPYLGGGVRGTLGAHGRFTTTSDRDTTFVVLSQPYGISDFGEVAATAALELDLRDRPAAPTKGIWAQVTGNYFPAVLSVADSGAFGTVDGFVAGYVTPFEKVTLALRAGGRKVWGAFPFQESAFLGGTSLRGYRDQRFAGDAAVYFNSTLRVHLTEVFALVPNSFGLLGLFDAGRVWYNGVSDGSAHFGYGGGVYFAPLKDPKSAIIVGAAGGDDGAVFFLHLGFGY